MALFVYDIRPLAPTAPNHWTISRMLIDSLAVIGGLVLLIGGSDRFVLGAAAGARNLGVPPLLVGLTVVAFATSAPEVLVSAIAALRGEPGLAFGNAIGSNIVNIGLVLGLVATIKPIALTSATLRREMPALLAVTLLTVSLLLDSFISRMDGIVMLIGLVIVMIWLAQLGMRSAANDSLATDPIATECEAGIPDKLGMKAAAFWFAVGLAALLFGAQLLVDGAVNIASTLGVSDIVIGVTLVALGTSLPEFAVSLVSALRKEHGLAIGNIIGSNIFNLLAVIGVAAAIEPSAIAPSVLSVHLFVMVAFTLALFGMTHDAKNELSRIEGLALFSAFVAYQGYVIATAV